MKTYIKNILITCFIALGFAACTKDEIDTYSGTDTIYFKWSVEGTTKNIKDSKTDSTSVSFAYEFSTVTDSIYMIPVKTIGKIVDFDREFKIQLLPTSTGVEGTDFILPTNLFIPANQVETEIPITLLRTPKLKQQAVSVKVSLVANNYFNTNYIGTNQQEGTKRAVKYDQFEVAISDILTKPKIWDSFMHYYLGDWSAKKLTLYASVNNIPIPNWDKATPDIGTFFGRKNVLKAYLIQQKNNGTPVLEDDGTEMKLGPYA